MGQKKKWTENEEVILRNTVFTNILLGRTVQSAYQEAGLLLNRSIESCSYRWKHEIRPQYMRQINELSGKISKNSIHNRVSKKWTRVEKEIATNSIKSHIKKGDNIESAVIKVSKKLNRSFRSVYNMYYEGKLIK